MELHQLRTFVAVAREGHLTRAADRLHLSQPSISAHIKTLEKEIGLNLFDRTPKGMRLTKQGETLLAHAYKVLEAGQSLLTEAQMMQEIFIPKLLIGVPADAALPELSDLIANLRNLYPGIELNLEQRLSGALLKDIRTELLDFGFIVDSAPPPDMQAIALKKIKFRVVAPISWAMQLERANWLEIASLPWIFTPSECGMNRVAGNFFKAHHIEPRASMTANSSTSIFALLVAKAGVTLMPESSAKEAALTNQAVVWEHGAIEGFLYFVHRHNRASDPVIQALQSIVKKLWPKKSLLVPA